MSEIKAPGIDAARLALARVATDTRSALADAFAGRRPEPIDRAIPDAYLLLLAAVEVADGLAEENARLVEVLTERDEARAKLTTATDVAQLAREVERLSRRVEALEASALPEGWEPGSLTRTGRRSLSLCGDALTGDYVLWDSAAEGGSRCVGRGATMRAAVEDWQRRGGR